MDDFIYVIGSLGYGRETIRETSIYRLDTCTFQIERLRATGESPGWIHRHRATPTSSREIVIRGDQFVTVVDDQQVHTDNQRVFILDLVRMQWRVAVSDGG